MTQHEELTMYRELMREHGNLIEFALLSRLDFWKDHGTSALRGKVGSSVKDYERALVALRKVLPESF